MSLRQEKKLQTRKALLEAAMNLTYDGRGFSSISLREITREAGVVPAAFYRHFPSVDELGLALVDEVGQRLRHIMREARQVTSDAGDVAIRTSVRGYVNYVRANRKTFAFIVRERLGGPPVVRESIANEVDFFVGELTRDLRMFPPFADMAEDDRHMIAHLTVHTVFYLAADVLELTEDQSAQEEELVARTIKQLRLIFLGARQWRPSRVRI